MRSSRLNMLPRVPMEPVSDDRPCGCAGPKRKQRRSNGSIDAANALQEQRKLATFGWHGEGPKSLQRARSTRNRLRKSRSKPSSGARNKYAATGHTTVLVIIQLARL